MTDKPFYKLYPTVEEVPAPVVANITGSIPSWLRGTFIRTGPGKFDFKDFTVNHYLDGYAMLTKFEISETIVTYENKFLETDAFKKAKVAQRPVIAEFGTRPSPDPSKSVFTRFLPSLIPQMTDNVNNSLFQLGTEYFATVDTCYFRQIDPFSMTCGEKFDTSRLFGLNIWSSHPLKDEEGYTYNIGTSFITGLKYSVVKIPPVDETRNSKEVLKKGEIICSISSRSTTAASICHSFGMTQNYIIFVEMPAVVVGSKVLAAVLTKSCSKDFIEWRPELKNRFCVIEKQTGKVVKVEFVSSDSFFFMHFINCFEVDNNIVVDIICFPNLNCIHVNLSDLREGNEGLDEESARARRFVIPLVDINDKDLPEGVNLISESLQSETTASAVKIKKQIILNHEFLSELGIEAPKIHKNFHGKKYNIFYGGGPRAVGHYRNALCKFNINTKETKLFRESEHQFLGEPTFVPNPQSEDEDDGILISVASTAHENEKCYLIFLNGKTMQEIARAQFDIFLPTAVHSIFLPSN